MRRGLWGKKFEVTRGRGQDISRHLLPYLPQSKSRPPDICSPNARFLALRRMISEELIESNSFTDIIERASCSQGVELEI